MSYEILDSIDEIIYICNIETYEMIYANKKLRDLVKKNLTYDLKTQKCYEYVNSFKSPCVFCNNERLKKEKKCVGFIKHGATQQYFLVSNSILYIEGKQCHMQLAVDVSNMRDEIYKLSNSIDAEKKLENCIRQLGTVETFQESVDSVLNKTLEYFDGDRAYIFELDWEHNLCANIFEKHKEGIPSLKEKKQTLSISDVGIGIKLFNENSIIVIKDIDELKNKEAYKNQYNLLVERKIKSLIVVSISYNGKLQGFLGVNNPKININDTNFLENLSFFIKNEIQKSKLSDTVDSLSNYDMLTGLNNRNAYNTALHEINKSNHKYKGALFVDMNGLKYLNDNFGNKYGDEKLCDLANILRQNFDEKNIYRVSGDEFAILCTDLKYDEFIKKCEQLNKKLNIDEKGLGAVGYAWDNNNIAMEDLVRQSEMLMYIEKQKYYSENSLIFKNDPPAYLSKLANELKGKEFIVYLQPKYSLYTQTIYGAEALVRMKTEEGKIIPPGKFINILEKENLISYVDFLVFTKVCELLVKWEKSDYPPLTISSNFSRITLAQEDFVDKIVEICNKTGVNCKQIILEITESFQTINMEKLLNTMRKLKKTGLRFALDDMGTEYATLEVLELEELDMAKIDRSMIMRISNGERSKTIISQVINLCHKLGIDCVAEGVETNEQMEILKNIGCDKIQGYFIGKPMPIDEFEKKYM